MYISHIFEDVCNVRLPEYNNVIDYTSGYQIAFDKFISFINKDSWMSKKNIKMTL